jgi:hypothetical protein
MGIPFLDRHAEIAKLKETLGKSGSALVVLYGRRRCGKSTLLQQVLRGDDVYYVADQQESPLQIQALASQIGKGIPAFAEARYTGWPALFASFSQQAKQGTVLFLDEFPYLVQSATELPSVIQKWADHRPSRKWSLVLCGSSQRMMQGLVMDAAEPLYGRADEIIRLRPLEPGWIQDAWPVMSDAAMSVEAYSVWGGIPRYWELASRYRSLDEALDRLVFDRDGLLHEEPMRLLLDDQRGAVQSASILHLIGNGCHRISEIAARVGKPAGSLTRPIALLIELGLIRREVPFGETPRSTKRTQYRLEDPFLAFYLRFVNPHKSELERGIRPPALTDWKEGRAGYVGLAWEELARRSVPWLKLSGDTWGMASRWWGSGLDGEPMEIDVVAESVDKQQLLIGEVKWGLKVDVDRVAKAMEKKLQRCPFLQGRQVVKALWLSKPQKVPKEWYVFTPQDVLHALKR